MVCETSDLCKEDIEQVYGRATYSFKRKGRNLEVLGKDRKKTSRSNSRKRAVFSTGPDQEGGTKNLWDLVIGSTPI